MYFSYTKFKCHVTFFAALFRSTNIFTFRQKEIARIRKLSDVKAPEVPIYNEYLRPGFCRVSLPFFMSDAELAFVLEALKMVATEGWKILPQYVVNPETGQWRHHTCSVVKDKKSLFSIRFNDGKMTANERRISGKFKNNCVKVIRSSIG